MIQIKEEAAWTGRTLTWQNVVLWIVSGALVIGLFFVFARDSHEPAPDELVTQNVGSATPSVGHQQDHRSPRQWQLQDTVSSNAGKLENNSELQQPSRGESTLALLKLSSNTMGEAQSGSLVERRSITLGGPYEVDDKNRGNKVGWEMPDLMRQAAATERIRFHVLIDGTISTDIYDSALVNAIEHTFDFKNLDSFTYADLQLIAKTRVRLYKQSVSNAYIGVYPKNARIRVDKSYYNIILWSQKEISRVDWSFERYAADGQFVGESSKTIKFDRSPESGNGLNIPRNVKNGKRWTYAILRYTVTFSDNHSDNDYAIVLNDAK